MADPSKDDEPKIPTSESADMEEVAEEPVPQPAETEPEPVQEEQEPEPVAEDPQPTETEQPDPTTTEPDQPEPATEEPITEAETANDEINNDELEAEPEMEDEPTPQATEPLPADEPMEEEEMEKDEDIKQVSSMPDKNEVEDKSQPSPVAAPTPAPTPPATAPAPSNTPRTRDIEEGGEPKEEKAPHPGFKEVEETGQWGEIKSSDMIIMVILALVIVGGAIAAAVILTGRDGDEVDMTRTSSPTPAPTPLTADLLYPDLRASLLANEFVSPSISAFPEDPAAFASSDATDTPQEQAFRWALYDDEGASGANNNVTVTRWAFAAIYYSLGGDSWTNKNGWLSASNVCSWHGITCNVFNTTIEEIDLSSNNLVGTIPLELSLLTTVKAIWMRRNSLSGEIPGDALGSMPNLSILYLEENQLSGTVPRSLRDNGRLQTLFLQYNDLTGLFPLSFCPASLVAERPVRNIGLDCDEVQCTCCTEFDCYY